MRPILIIMCALIPSISLAQMESEHYEVNSYSYGESAHTKMSSESFSFQDVGDVADPKSKTTGSRKNIPQSEVFGISSSTNLVGSDDAEISQLPNGAAIIKKEQTDSVLGVSASDGVLTTDNFKVNQIENNDKVLENDDTSIMQKLNTNANRLWILFFVFCVLMYLRFYTKIGRKWAPF